MASIFTNLDFEKVDASGAPLGWACECTGIPAACRTTTRAEHGARALDLPSGCFAFQSTRAFDHTHGLRFDYFASGGVIYPADTLILSTEVDPSGANERLISQGRSASSEYDDVASQGTMRTADAQELVLLLQNNNGADDPSPDGPHLVIDDIVAVQDVPNPEPKVGALVRAEHIDQFSYQGVGVPASLYTPLPADWAAQTPLYVELTVAPENVVDHIEYVAEAGQNWGAVVHFAGAVSAPTVTLTWRSVSLVWQVPASERPGVYATIEEPSPWLQATPVADAGDPRIVAAAQFIVSQAQTPLDKMLDVIGWTSANIRYGWNGNSLDALSVFLSHQGTCTGFANLASALGRAAGVPTRAVANILVGMAQDVHSINEFYLGPSEGWRRVEPQSSAPIVADDYGLVLRLVLPDDENATADDTQSMWTARGVPLHTLTMPVEGAAQFDLPARVSPTFADCASCPNRADPQADLRGDDATMKMLFERARAAWQTDFKAYRAGGPLPPRQDVRRQALGARTMADVQALLGELP